jgi:trans-2-enoyl-CoA reductase
MRVTSDEVKVIYDTTLTDTQIDAFINTANIVVNKNLEDEITDDDLLKEIELYLAAHFCSMRDQRVSSNSVRSVSESYQYRLGLRLEVTMYGQQALILDNTGTLANLNKGRKMASISFIGGDLSEELS